MPTFRTEPLFLSLIHISIIILLSAFLSIFSAQSNAQSRLLSIKVLPIILITVIIFLPVSTFTTVSYTHLDVYKRQAKRHIHLTPEAAAEFGVTDKQIVSVKVGESTGRATTVSYTHLCCYRLNLKYQTEVF